MGERPSQSRLEVGGATPAAVTVREAVRAIAAPAVAVRILQRALHRAETAEIPQGGSRLRAFVEGHLQEATAFVMGDDAANALREQLEPLLVRIPSLLPQPQAPKRAISLSELSDPAPEPEPEPAVRVRVLVATLDDPKRRALRDHLRREAEVQIIEDVVALFDAIQAHSDEDLVIVVDCHDPSVQPATLATIASDLPSTSIVVLWGAGEGELERTTLLVTDASNWLACDREAGTDTIAMMVRTML